MFQDTVYFDAVLGALHGDQVTQCRCVVRATQLGQSAAEDAARLREEAKAVEAELKHSMQERALAVKSMRTVVDTNKRVSRSHVRAEVSGGKRVSPRLRGGRQGGQRGARGRGVKQGDPTS